MIVINAKLAFFMALVCVLLLSCEKEVPVSEFDMNFEPKLILDGGITEEFMSFYLYQSNSVLNNEHPKSVGGASLSLFKDGILLPVDLQVIVDTTINHNLGTESINYFYKVEDPLITLGSKYNVQVNVPGHNTLQASNSPLGKVKIELKSIEYLYSSFSENHFNVKFEVNDEQQENNFYSFGVVDGSEIYRYGYFNFIKPKESITSNYFSFSDQILNNKCFDIELIEYTIDNKHVDSLFIEFYQMDSVNYHAGRTAEQQRAMYGTAEFYAFEPVNVYSNVANGLGAFYGFSKTFHDTILFSKLVNDIKTNK